MAIPIDARTLESVFGNKTNITYREPTFIDPTFPFKVTRVSDNEMTAIFNPPFEHAKPKNPFFLTVESDIGGISITPFQVLPDLSGERTSRDVGGVVIGMGGDEKLVFVYSEHPQSYSIDHEHIDSFLPGARLLKVRAEDPNILVKPQLEYHKGKYYVLQNDHRGYELNRNGLQIIENSLKITHTNGVTLVERKVI